MFANPLYKQLHAKIVRYIAPYDAAVRPYSLDKAISFIQRRGSGSRESAGGLLPL